MSQDTIHDHKDCKSPAIQALRDAPAYLLMVCHPGKEDVEVFACKMELNENDQKEFLECIKNVAYDLGYKEEGSV